MTAVRSFPLSPGDARIAAAVDASLTDHPADERMVRRCASVAGQMSSYAGRRWRMVVYRVSDGGGWSGFVESPTVLVGFLGRHPSRRRAMLAAARLVAARRKGARS